MEISRFNSEMILAMMDIMRFRQMTAEVLARGLKPHAGGSGERMLLDYDSFTEPSYRRML